MAVKSAVNKILFVTLSNIGDAILTIPVLDQLRQEYPQAKITVICGERPSELFAGNPYIERVIVYNKRAKFRENLKLFHELAKEKFDLVVDLRNTFFGAFLSAGRRTPLFLFIPKKIKHMRDRHLYRAGGGEKKDVNRSLHIEVEDEKYIGGILEKNNISAKDRLIVIAAGARSHIKRWAKERFALLAQALIKETQAKIILIGDKDDLAISQYIAGKLGQDVLDLTAKTTLAQLACLLKKAGLLITNDSAALHMAGYLNIPAVAIFGPTDEAKYGPWSDISAAVTKEIFCRPCAKAQCRFGTLECMQLVKVEDVLRQVRGILSACEGRGTRDEGRETRDEVYKRILIVRTDRIGDVLLSTPVAKAMRCAYPNAYIAMMVSPYAKEIVEGNPYLDQVIVYDKEGKHKSLWRTIKFARNLKKKKFDLAIILHPANRVHLVAFFAGIRRRIGYNRKMGFLLTDRIRHEKQFGQKHESEYSLDLVRYLGIKPEDKNLFMPIRDEYEKWAEELLKAEGITQPDKLLAMHPGASCPSKVWPQERFAQVADRLAEKYGFKVLLVAGPKDFALTQNCRRHMHSRAIDLGGRTSVGQLASLLKRCRLFISCDSGPVHIAAAVGTPVVSIFGRAQPGLSPQRWGPLGKESRVLHKGAGCIACLAHNCVKEFACLKAISVADVVAAADALLESLK